jgi:hypothetical protein
VGLDVLAESLIGGYQTPNAKKMPECLYTYNIGMRRKM